MYRPSSRNASADAIIGHARQAGLIDLNVRDIRPYSKRKHKNTDDYPFGGGAGMLMMAQPIADAIRDATPAPFMGKRILLSPRGQVLTQVLAQQLSQEEHLRRSSTHEGVDERSLSITLIWNCSSATMCYARSCRHGAD